MTFLSPSSFPLSSPVSVAVIGAGSWGTALAALLAAKGGGVTLWCLERAVADEINRNRHNPLYLSDISLPDGLRAETDLSHVVATHAILVMVVPTPFIRQVLQSISTVVRDDTRFVYASKGVEVETLALVSDIHTDVLGQAWADRACFLSGPSFAREVLQQQPTAVAIAGTHPDVVQEIQTLFHTPVFRTYRSDDVVGVELGGALKNIIALAAGMSDGLGFGHNARAALITRGLAEMTRLGLRMGAKAETFAGLSGLGDLLLTATSTLSRNHTVGSRIGRGETLEQIQSSMHEVAEGVKTTLSVHRLAHNMGVDMPITQAVHDILYRDRDPRAMVKALMERSLKAE